MRTKQLFTFPEAAPALPDGYKLDSVQCVTESTDYDEYGTLEDAVGEYAHYPHSYEYEKASLEALVVPKNWDGDPYSTLNYVWDRISGCWFRG